MRQQAPDLLRYSRVAVALHWAIAVLIGFNLAVGYFMEGFSPPWRTFVVEMHISAGITVLALTVARVLWRLGHHPPARRYPLGAWQGYLANFVHLGLYAAMVFMPLTGWALVSAHPPAGSAGARYVEARQPASVTAAQHRRGPIMIWQIVELPSIGPIAQVGAQPDGVAGQKLLHEDFVLWHQVGSFVLLGLLALHLTGALKHELLDGEAELARMTIGKRKPQQPLLDTGPAQL